MNTLPDLPCPPGRRPHKERVRDIDNMMMEGQTAGIGIDDTPEHRAWYLAEIAEYPRLTVIGQGKVAEGVYIIKVKAGPASKEVAGGH